MFYLPLPSDQADNLAGGTCADTLAAADVLDMMRLDGLVIRTKKSSLRKPP